VPDERLFARGLEPEPARDESRPLRGPLRIELAGAGQDLLSVAGERVQCVDDVVVCLDRMGDELIELAQVLSEIRDGCFQCARNARDAAGRCTPQGDDSGD